MLIIAQTTTGRKGFRVIEKDKHIIKILCVCLKTETETTFTANTKDWNGLNDWIEKMFTLLKPLQDVSLMC